MLEVGNAVFDRWNDASLDTSVAELYPGAKHVTSRRNVAGSPAETDTPRAEFVMEMESVVQKSRGTYVHRQPVRFQVWDTQMAQTVTHVDAITSAFVNSELAASNPFAIPASVGVVLAVEDAGGTVLKQDDEMFQGVKQIEVLWRKANVIPS
jgi:hypothetical protein